MQESGGAEGSRVGQDFGSILGGEGGDFGAELGFGGWVEFGRRGGAGGYGHANFEEERLGTRGGTDAQHAHGLIGRIVELVGSVCGDVNGLTGTQHLVRAAKDDVELALEEDEGFLEVVAMRRRPAAGRNVHINEAEAAGGVFSGEKKGVGVSGDADVREIRVAVRAGDGGLAAGVVGRDGYGVLRGGVRLVGHVGTSGM